MLVGVNELLERFAVLGDKDLLDELHGCVQSRRPAEKRRRWCDGDRVELLASEDERMSFAALIIELCVKVLLCHMSLSYLPLTNRPPAPRKNWPDAAMDARAARTKSLPS